MNHDRIHAKQPSHAEGRWSVGTIEWVTERDGHCVVGVRTESDDVVELTVTFEIRDLFVSRLDIDADESPAGQTVWYRQRGGPS